MVDGGPLHMAWHVIYRHAKFQKLLSVFLKIHKDPQLLSVTYKLNGTTSENSAA